MPIVFADGDQDYLEKLNDLADAYESAADIVETVNDHIAGTADKHAASAIVNTPAGNIAATTVQAAINELDTEKARLDGATFTGAVSATSGVEGADFRALTADNAAGGAGVNTASVAFANGGTVKARIRSAVYGDGYMAFHVNDDTERMRLTPGGLVVTGSISATANVTFPSYTVGTLPAVSTAGGMIYVSNETGGAVSAFSDGANWRRVTDRAIVS